MLAGKRSVRVAEEIQKEIASLLLERVKDPRAREATITGVRMSDDLKVSWVYFSVIGGQERIEIVRGGLNSAKGYIKRELGLRMGLRYVPSITFIHDTSLEKGERMEKMLQGLFEDKQEDVDG